MRVLYLNPVGFVGGAERVLLSVMAAVRAAEPSWDLRLLVATPGPLLERAAEVGVPGVLLPMPAAMAAAGDSRHRGSGWLSRSAGLLRQGVVLAPGLCCYGRRLRRAVREIAPDLIHSNGIKSHLLARLAGTPPVVWHVHDFYGERPFVRRMLRWARRGVAGAIAVSEAVGRETRELFPGLPTRVVPNTVDTRTFAPGPGDPDLLDRLAGLSPAPTGTGRVGLVATYARWKGHDVFLRAAAEVLRGQPTLAVRFYLIGGPIYHTEGSQFSPGELRSLAGSLGIEAHVGFVGFRPDPADVYRALDVVVHASTRPEPFGLTIAEAMACGRAVVVARAGGAVELFTHDEDAVGVEPGWPEVLARVLRDLLADGPRRWRLGDNARRTALCRFSPERLGPQVLAAYLHFLRTADGLA